MRLSPKLRTLILLEAAAVGVFGWGLCFAGEGWVLLFPALVILAFVIVCHLLEVYSPKAFIMYNHELMANA